MKRSLKSAKAAAPHHTEQELIAPRPFCASALRESWGERMKNDRTENRIEAYETGKATVLGHPDVTLACQIRNFSRSGMGITVDQDIPSGKVVKVTWDDHFLIGRVQDVSAVGGAFRIGLELLYCSKWNEPMTYLLASAGARRVERFA